MNTLRSILVAAVGLLIGFSATAEYPEKPIRILIPFPTGGAAEQSARIVAPHLSRALGQPVIVETRPGADGQIATTEAARATPDGYTLILASATGMNYVPALRKSVPYDPTRDFSPISTFGVSTTILVVPPSLPVTSAAGLLDYIRANPGKLSFGTGNAPAILATSELRRQAGANFVDIPYKGDALLMPDLLAGRIQGSFLIQGLAMPHVQEGKLRALATNLPKRSSLYPDIPTLAESGLVPLGIKQWFGFVGPAGMPKGIVERLSREINIVLARPDVSSQIEKVGYVVSGSTPDELAVLIKEQLEVWQRAVLEGRLTQE